MRRQLAFLSCLLIGMVAVGKTAGCAQILGIEEIEPDPDNPGPPPDAGDNSGQDAKPPVDAGSSCIPIDVQALPILPTAHLLVDHSGSLEQSFGAGTRVDAIRFALFDPDIGVISTLDSRVQFGMTLFTGFAPPDVCPLLTTVDAAPSNYEQIEAAMFELLTPENLGDHTPTGESLLQVTEQLLPPGPGEKQVVILITDGEPDTCDNLDANGTPEARLASEMAAGKAYDTTGIETYVVSVGNELAQDHLQRLANVGVGKAPVSPNPAPFFVAEDEIGLLESLKLALREVPQCNFAVEPPLFDTALVNVALDGRDLVLGSDWEIINDVTLALLEPACSEYLENLAELEIEITCTALR